MCSTVLTAKFITLHERAWNYKSNSISLRRLYVLILELLKNVVAILEFLKKLLHSWEIV